MVFIEEGVILKRRLKWLSKIDTKTGITMIMRSGLNALWGESALNVGAKRVESLNRKKT